MSTKSKFALGAIVGAVAGVVAGVLTAPKSGKEIRADLKGKAAELKDEAVRRTEDVKSRSSEAVVDMKHKAEHYKERGERTVDSAVESAKKGFYDKK